VKDLISIVENRVKDSVAKACMAMGINKNETYYLVGGHGAVGPLIATNQETGEQAIMGFQPLWVIGFGLRNTGIGLEPIVGSRPVVGVFPPATDIEPVVFQLVAEVQELKIQQDRQAMVPQMDLTKLNLGK
jgi:hypothetical protein